MSARKRRYFLLMSVRIPALFLAAGAHVLWHNPWITVAIVIGSIPIPWIAVIGANDRPPLPKGQTRSYSAGGLTSYTPQALPPGITGASRPPGTPGPPNPDPHHDPDQSDESDPTQ